MVNLIKLKLSNQQVTFTPDSFRDFSRTRNLPKTGDFQVTIVNTSQKFASFQLELWPQGSEASAGARWYQVEPHVSAKKPPGASTTFQVTLLKSPVPAYDVTIPLTVRVVSVELVELFAETTVFLRIVRPHRTLHVYLPFEDLTVHPGNRLQIPVLLYNLNPTARSVALQLKGLDPTWFPEGTEQTVQVDSGDSLETSFWCAPPAVCQSSARMHDLLLEAIDQNNQDNSASTRGRLEILPFGEVQIDCPKRQQWVPSRQVWWTRRRFDTAVFDLIVSNQSNIAARIALPVAVDTSKHIETVETNTLNLEPAQALSTVLEARVKRPWLGLTRTRFLTTHPQVAYASSGEPANQVAVQPSSQALELKICPVIPLLLQLGGGLFGLLLLWLIWWLTPRPHHQAPVNALTLMANGTTVISGSRDQTLRFWQVNRDPWITDIRRLKNQGILQTEDKAVDKAVRTLQQLPTEVEEVAVGLETGEIQIWEISPPNQSKVLFEQGKPDRVFALDFTDDSKLLFSGHGSGQVRLWQMTGDENQVFQRLYPPNGQHFSIAALTVVDQPEQTSLVAIGGQFNRFMLWDWRARRAYDIPYQWKESFPNFEPVISRQSYITDLTSDMEEGKRIVSADNQGFITVWDRQALQTCIDAVNSTQLPSETRLLTSSQTRILRGDQSGNQYGEITRDCAAEAIVSQWQAGTEGKAIRSVAITENGCYLASVGDDGQVVLWSLTTPEQLASNSPDRTVLQQFRQGYLNSVDIHYTVQNNQEVVFIASDTPDNRVRLYRRQVANNDCQ